MKQSKTSLAIVFSVLAGAGAALADIPPPRHALAHNPIEGRWLWKSDKGDCAETHEYLANGVKLAQSGQETLEKRYAISKIRGASAPDQYFVAETITKTNGKTDCAGSLSKVGNTSNIYIFAEGNDAYVTCGSVDKTTCYGSARRVR